MTRDSIALAFILGIVAGADKTLRQTTCYHRAKWALKAVEQAEDVFGFSP